MQTRIASNPRFFALAIIFPVLFLLGIGGTLLSNRPTDSTGSAAYGEGETFSPQAFNPNSGSRHLMACSLTFAPVMTDIDAKEFAPTQEQMGLLEENGTGVSIDEWVEMVAPPQRLVSSCWSGSAAPASASKPYSPGAPPSKTSHLPAN